MPLRFVRFILSVLVPAALLAAGIDGFLEAGEREAVEARLAAMATVLREVKSRILTGSTRITLAAEAVEAFSAAGTLEARAFGDLRRSLERGDGARRVLALAAEAHGGGIRFRAAAGDDLKFRTLLEKIGDWLAASLLGSETAADLARLEKACAPMAKMAFGREATPPRLAANRATPLEVRWEGRDAWLYWDFAGAGTMPTALVFVLIDRERFEALHGSGTLVARANERSREAGFDVALVEARPGADASAVVPAADLPVPAPPLRGEISLPGVERLHSLLLLDERPDGATLLHASCPRAPFTRPRARFRRAVPLALFLLLAGWIGWERRRRGTPLRVPLRARLAGVFILAALLPVSGLLYLGRHHAREAESAARREVEAEIRAKLASAAEFHASFFQGTQGRMRELFRRAEKHAGDLARFTAEVEALESADPRLLESFDRLIVVGPDKKTLLDNASLSNAFRDRLGRNTGRADVAILSAAKSLLSNMVSDTNGVEGDDTREVTVGFLRSILRSTSRTTSALAVRGRLVPLEMGDSLSWAYFDVLTDERGRAFAGAALVHDASRATLGILRNLVSENHANPEERVRIGVRHERLGHAVYPGPAWFSGGLGDLGSRAARTGVEARASLDRDGRAFVALAVPLALAGGVALVGLAPRDPVDAARVRAGRMFAALILSSILAASLLGLAVARKFVAPVRLFGEGVSAIARGDLSFRMSLASPDELGALSATFNRMVAGLEEKERMSRYVSDFVRGEVARGALDAKAQAGVEREAAILFCNIPGFEALAAAHEPSLVVDLLNRHFARATPLIQAAGGVVDKFIADAVMAVFRPEGEEGPRPELRAAAAAYAIMGGLARFNEENAACGLAAIELAIGIDAGRVIQGSIGSRAERVDLTVIGDTVNTAARLEAMAKGGARTRIFLSRRAAAPALEVFQAVEVGELRLKGKAEPLPVMEIEGPAAGAVERLLASPAPRARTIGILLAAAAGGEGAGGAVAARLDDPDPLVRGEAARALARLGGGVAPPLDALERRLVAEKDPRVRASLVTAFGRLAEGVRLAALVPLLSDPDGRVRANVAESLGRAGPDSAAAQAVRALLSDPEPRARANAAVLLDALGDPRGAETLLAMAGSEKPGERASGAFGLGECALRAKTGATPGGGPGRFEALRGRAAETLHALLDDEDPACLRQAVGALGRIGERASVGRLARLYQRTLDEDLRLAILAAIDEIGSYGVVRDLRARRGA